MDRYSPLGWGWTALGAAVLGALAVLAVAAPPVRAVEASPSGWSTAFGLRGTHGYSILGVASAKQEDKHGALLLLVTKRDAAAIYSAPATVTSNTLDADLGALGEIAVELRGTGTEKTVRSACGGKPITYDDGALVGSIEFRGEEGFTQAIATSTPMLVKPILDLVCPGRSVSGVSGGGVHGARLRAIAGPGVIRREVQLNVSQPGSRPSFEASVRERHGTIRIERSIQGRLPKRSLVFDSKLGTAFFWGAAPFSGSASFRRGSGLPTWRGDLAIDFPGRSNVPLAGPEFAVSLAHAARHQSTKARTR